MREVGLLDVEADARGGVGRPQHRYSPAPDAPSFGFEPPVMPDARRRDAAGRPPALGGDGDDAADAGRAPGPRRCRSLRRRAERASKLSSPSSTGWASTPEVGEGDDADTAVVAFGHCPFGDLPNRDPDIVCGLHRGLIEGFVDAMGDAEIARVLQRRPPTPCRRGRRDR